MIIILYIVVYKFLLKTPASTDRIVAANINSVGYAKALIAAEALCELKLCSVFDNDGIPVIKVTNTGAKVNLGDAAILKKLRGEI